MQWSSYDNGRIWDEYNMQNTSFIDEIMAVMVKDEMVKFSGTYLGSNNSLRIHILIPRSVVVKAEQPTTRALNTNYRI